MATPFLVVKNRAKSTLAADISDAALELTVAAGEGAKFPSTYPFDITIENEILQCSNRVDDVFTVARGQQGTTPAAHLQGKAVRLHVTAKSISDLNSAVNTLEDSVIKKDGSVAFTGDQSMGVHKLREVVNPSLDQDAATKKYVDDAVGAGGGGDMLKATYDINTNGIVDNSEKLEDATKAQVQDHVPQAHTLASHSTKAHSELTGVGADDHHAQAHTLASHSTKAHTELTDVTADQHHARSHDHSLAGDGTPIAVAGVPNLPASKITSERFPLARIPDGTNGWFLKAQGAGVDPIYASVPGGGDMLKSTYDPNEDGVIALAQLDTLVCSEAEADSKITTHKGDASAHHAKTGDNEVHGLLAQGLAGNKPAVGIAGRLYYATDTLVLTRDSGTTWEEKLRGEAATRLAYLSEKEHHSTTGLTDDDHTQYPLLAGRAGGQTLKGGTAAGDILTLESTAHATKGHVKIAAGSSFCVGEVWNPAGTYKCFEVDGSGYLQVWNQVYLNSYDILDVSILQGKSAGMTIKGGSAAGVNLTLESTSNASKGSIKILDTILLQNNKCINWTDKDATIRSILQFDNANGLFLWNPVGILSLMEDCAYNIRCWNGLGTGREFQLDPSFASAVDTLRDSSALRLGCEYWDGAGRVLRNFQLIHKMTATTPASQIDFKIGAPASEVLIASLTDTKQFVPGSTGSGSLGTSALKWLTGYVGTWNVGDLCFNNGFRLTETKNGIALLNAKGKTIKEWRDNESILN